MKKIICIALLFACFILQAFGQESNVPKKPEKPPATADEYYEAARWELWNHRQKEAYEFLEKALALEPDHLNSHYTRGVLKRQGGDCKAAIADFDFVVQLIPDSYMVYEERAECRIILKDYAGALQDLDTALANLSAQGKWQYRGYSDRAKLKYLMGKLRRRDQ